MLIDILKTKDKEALKNYIFEKLSKKHTQQEILSKGINLYSTWMKESLEKINTKTFLFIGEIGGCYEASNIEYSDLYEFDEKINYRIPKGYSLNIGGLFINDEKIHSFPVYPSSILIIDKNRYSSFYKFKNYYTGEAFVSQSVPPNLCKKFTTKFLEYLNLCVLYNSTIPRKMEVVKYES